MSLATVGALATVYRTIGLVLLAIVLVVAVAYVLVNVLFAGKAELGSEIELAANRKPYLDDEQLEGPKLDRALSLGLLMLVVLAVGLPLYWIMEPGRQENAAAGFGHEFAAQGAELFAPTGENPNALNCAGCHGGLEGGMVEDFNLSLPDGTVQQVDWRAPALGNVLLRYSRDEVEYIITYGRPGTPMPAWGVEGGGALNEQQVQSLVDYLDENTQDPEASHEEIAAQLDLYMAAEFEDGEPVFDSEGEALFNMGLLDNYAGGAYACARCHTANWSYAQVETTTGDDGQMVVDRDDFEAATEASGCGGALGPNLCNGATERQFPGEPEPEQEPDESDEDFQARLDEYHPYRDMIDFVSQGSEDGIGYGRRGQGSGKMPGFGVRPAEEALWWLNGGQERTAGQGMLTVEMIEAIVEYERDLEGPTTGGVR